MSLLLFRKMEFYEHIENMGNCRETENLFSFNSSLCSARETRFPDAQEGRLPPQQGAEGQGVRGTEDQKSCWEGSGPGSPGTSLEALSKWAGGDMSRRNISEFPSAYLSTLLSKRAIS